MKAAVLVEQNKPLEIYNDIDLPRLDAGQALVKVHYSGICGKQLDEITGRQPDSYIPHLLGHEGSGVVIGIGPGVIKVMPGNHVVLHWMKGSGIDARPPRCRHRGRELNAGCVTTFNDYAVVSENRLTPMPDDAPLDVLALLGCAVTTGLGIVFNDIGLKPGQSIAVVGLGGVGLNVVQGAALVNAYPIIGIDTVSTKQEFARQFGITDTWHNNPIDAVVDTTGNTIARDFAYRSTAHDGITVLAGVPRFDDRMTIDSFPLHHGRRLIGSHGGNTNPDVDIPRYYELYRRGVLKLDELITKRVALDDINSAIDEMRSGTLLGRCLIEM